jgi:CBS-domain-containing membrane protein
MAVALLALLSAWSGHVLIVAPLGASSVLLFGTPLSPLAQPRNVVVGHTLGGLLGVALVALFGQGPLVLLLAVGLAILLAALRCQNVAVAISNSFAGVAPVHHIQDNRVRCGYSGMLWRVCDQEGNPCRSSQ